jgi:signal transduction histidine kinase
MNTEKSDILYIDDERENLSGFKFVFKKYYNVHIALTADEAWLVLQDFKIKVIISDQRMPKVTGTQFLEQAAKKYPSAFRIILTGYTDVQDIITAINKGKIFQFIRKPWDKDEVKVIIDNALKHYDLTESNSHLLDSLKINNAELEKKVLERTKELQNHKDNLEFLIKQRTSELEAAKEKAEESDRLKSAFLANVSHEIRTPMNAIVGFSELLISEEHSKEEQEEFKNQVVTNSAALLRLIDDIIDISKIEANQISIDYDDYNLNQILLELQAIYTEQKSSLDKSHIKILVDIPENQNLNIHTDKIRLFQIISNLLGNSLKFTDEGYIKFGYKLVAGENQKPFLQFYVEDTGIGISKAAQTYIFERFRKANSNNDKIYRGTGLGLFICKNLVEQFGGEIWIESEPNKGATFHFQLPYTPSSKALPDNLDFHSKLPPIEYDFKNKLIIVAEDEDSSYYFIEKIIKETQAKILRAKNGEEAIDLIKKHGKIDLILMDIQMPVMDGYDAISIIKEEYCQIPIIAQTAYAFAEQKQSVLDTGCNDLLSKPFQKQELLRTIKKHINT